MSHVILTCNPQAVGLRVADSLNLCLSNFGNQGKPQIETLEHLEILS